MAITKTFARAPCPIFAGRGVDNEGFTIKMPYKTYLTCEKANIASERSLLTVFNYDLAEYVYNQTADAYAFGVYVETGAYTDAITDGKHMYAAKFFLKLSEAYSLGSGERHNCDIRAVSIGVEAAYDLSGVLHGAYISAQFKEDADGVTIGGYYLANTQTYGVIGLEVRTEAKDNGDGGITVGAAAFGCVGLFVAQKNDAAWTGNYAAIVIHVPYEGSDAIVGTTYGIRFDTGGVWAGTDFDVGIDLGDQAVIGIDIGAATTGITFTGDMTDCINIAVGCTPTAILDINGAAATIINIAVAPTTCVLTIGVDLIVPKFIAVGTYGNDVVWDQVDEFIEVFVETSSTSLSKPMARFRLAGHASTAHTGELCAVQIQSYQAASNVTDMIGLKVESGWKANGTLLSGGTYGWIGLLVRLEDLDFTMTGTGNAYVAELRTQMFDPASAFNGESSFLHILNLNDAVAAIDSVFYLEQAAGQAGVATYLIDMDAAVVPWNATTLRFAIRVVATAYYIPTGTVNVGIALGTVATGITLGTHSTAAITMAADTTCPQFMVLGTTTTGIQWDGVAENILIYIEATPTAMTTKTAVKINLEASNDGAVTQGRLECFRANVDSYSTNAITASIRALVGQVSFNGASTVTTSSYPQGVFGVIGSIWSGSATDASGASLAPLASFFGLETSSSVQAANSAMLYCYIFGKVAPGALINVWQGTAPSHMSYFLEVTSASSIDHAFCDSTTIDCPNNASSGRIAIRLGSTTYYVPFFADGL